MSNVRCQMHAARTSPLFASIVFTVSCGVHDVAQSSTEECVPLTGRFLVVGVAEEQGLGAQRQVRYGNSSSASAEAHHFEYVLDPMAGTVTSVFFNEAGLRTRTDAGTSEYSCKGGELVRESEVRGGSEGCSKVGRIRSIVSVSKNGSLVFSTRENWKFGVLCFAKPVESYRVVSFPKYKAPER
jgi:hypothetical protein